MRDGFSSSYFSCTTPVGVIIRKEDSKTVLCHSRTSPPLPPPPSLTPRHMDCSPLQNTVVSTPTQIRTVSLVLPTSLPSVEVFPWGFLPLPTGPYLFPTPRTHGGWVLPSSFRWRDAIRNVGRAGQYTVYSRVRVYVRVCVRVTTREGLLPGHARLGTETGVV